MQGWPEAGAGGGALADCPHPKAHGEAPGCRRPSQPVQHRATCSGEAGAGRQVFLTSLRAAALVGSAPRLGLRLLPAPHSACGAPCLGSFRQGECAGRGEQAWGRVQRCPPAPPGFTGGRDPSAWLIVFPVAVEPGPESLGVRVPGLLPLLPGAQAVRLLVGPGALGLPGNGCGCPCMAPEETGRWGLL